MQESPPEPSHVAAFTDSVAYEHKLRQYEVRPLSLLVH